MELYIWECEGKQEWGTKDSGLWPLWIMNCAVDEKGTTTFRRQLNDVTNLRPAKVVDADAVVLTEEELGDIKRYLLWGKKIADIEDFGTYHEDKIDRLVAQLTPPVTKTYLTTEQFIKVWKSLDDAKIKELSAVWFAAWSASLAVLAKDKITTEQFEILTKPWTSCGLSLFAEDWDEVLNPPVTEPTGFGAIRSQSSENQAEFCRKNGIKVGDYLAGDEGYGMCVIKIVYLGESSLIAKRVRSKNKIVNELENQWTLSGRDWFLINPTILSEGQK